MDRLIERKIADELRRLASNSDSGKKDASLLSST